jgi:hypothetical protein
MRHSIHSQYPVTDEEYADLERRRDKFAKEVVAKYGKKGAFAMSDGAALRLKCLVNSVKTCHGSEGEPYQQELALSAVYSNKEGSANAQWSKWTPAASLTMTVSNPAAFNKLKPGEFVYVDLIPCDKDSI